MRKYMDILHEANKQHTLHSVLRTIPQQPQTQVALNDQLEMLKVFATKLGLYDAADYLKGVLRQY